MLEIWFSELFRLLKRSLMKKFWIGLLASLLMLGTAYAITKTPAKDITADVTNFNRNLNATDTDVQKALQTLNDLVVSGAVNWGQIGGVITNQNWSSITPYLNSGAMNWSSVINLELQRQGINWPSANLFVDGTNIGINTLSANQKLVVNGTIYSTSGGFEFPDNTIQTSAATSTPPGGSSGQYQYNNGGVFAGGSQLYTNGTNVGIGTTTPLALLDVNRKVYITSGGKVGIGTFLPSNSGLSFSITTSDIGIATSDGTDNGQLTISGGGQSGGTRGATIYFSGNELAGNQKGMLQLQSGAGDGSVAHGSNVIAFLNSSGSENMRLDNSSGNLGIGSQNPGSLLDVAGTARMTGFKLSTNPSSGYVLTSGSTGIGTWMPAAASGVTSIATSSPITGGTITTTGTIGISQATTSTDGYLSSTNWNTFNGKQANLSLVAGTYSDGKACTYASSGTLLNCNTTLPTGTINSGTINRVARYSGATTLDSSTLIFDDSTNVGIGSVTPGQVLDVQGVIRGSGGSVTAPGLVMGGSANNDTGIYSGGTDDLRFANAGVNTMTLNSNGNVGIGTTAPGKLLTLSGTAATLRVLDPASAATALDLINSNGTMSVSATQGNLGLVTQSSNGNIIFSPNTVEAMRIQVGGNVGIGTWKPSSPLTIKGSTVMQRLTGANTACSTTCGAFACYFGEDTGVLGTMVDCADATADVCFCSK